MFEAFKIKEFDLQPIYERWKDGPVFDGNTKDLSVEEWLDEIKDGCTERGVPEEYWYKVAQNFMEPKAKARLDELKRIITKVQGTTFRWTWKTFRIAMLHMKWDEEETIRVQRCSSCMLCICRKDIEASNISDVPLDSPTSSEPRHAPPRPIVEELEEEPEPQGQASWFLEYITSEHPKTMSIISAILITAGSIPAIPEVAARAGGAILASETALTIGAVVAAAGALAVGAHVTHSQHRQEHSESNMDGTDWGIDLPVENWI